MNAVTVAERADSPAVAESTPRSKKKSLVRLAIGAAVIAGVVYGGHWWSVGRFIEDTDDAYVGGDVTVIGPKVPGYITQVAVTDNQVVHAGDLLVKLGRHAEAQPEFERAASLTRNARERQLLLDRAAACARQA